MLVSMIYSHLQHVISDLMLSKQGPYHYKPNSQGGGGYRRRSASARALPGGADVRDADPRVYEAPPSLCSALALLSSTSP